MKHTKFIKFSFNLLLFIFLCSYFTNTGGYYEYHLARKRNLTKEQMEQFEKDIEEGKDIDLNSYLENSVVDYSNNLTRKTSEANLKLNDYLKKIIGGAFKVLEKLVR